MRKEEVLLLQKPGDCDGGMRFNLFHFDFFPKFYHNEEERRGDMEKVKHAKKNSPKLPLWII